MNRMTTSIVDERPRTLSAADETRIRRAIRHLIQCSRSQDERVDVQYAFDLLGYLPPTVRAILEDEAAHTLAELVGSV